MYVCVYARVFLVLDLSLTPEICIMADSIHHWRIIWSSYKKLAWVGFEPTTTEFRSDAPTDWAIRPWVVLALSANFVQLHSFIVCSVSNFISAITFVSCHVYFNWNFIEVITWV